VRVTEDIVAGVMRQWEQVMPGLDTAPMAVIGRLNRCSALLQQAADAPLRGEGLTRPEFDILGALRRAGRELTPGRIARETFASGAAVTKRLRHLESRGLIARRPDDRDRRVTHLSLTDEGRALLDRLLPEQVAYDAGLLDGLGTRNQDQLAASLGELLVLLEGRQGSLLD
jgi:DNA-binding MarR family transcriptional regulator